MESSKDNLFANMCTAHLPWVCISSISSNALVPKSCTKPQCLTLCSCPYDVCVKLFHCRFSLQFPDKILATYLNTLRIPILFSKEPHKRIHAYVYIRYSWYFKCFCQFKFFIYFYLQLFTTLFATSNSKLLVKRTLSGTERWLCSEKHSLLL